jgi:tetratricopeptide (TPR) repeat protein
MPSIGFVLALTVAGLRLLQYTTIRPLFFYACMGVLICSQSIGTFTRNRIWNDELTFAAHEIQKNPDSVRSLTELGTIFIKAEKPALAEKSLQKALTIDPENIKVLINLYVLYMNLSYQNPQTAELYLQRIIQLIKNGTVIPNENQPLGKLAHHMFQINRYRESLLILEHISKTDGAANLFLHIGQCNLKLQRYSEAQAALEKALLLEPHNPEYKFYYAWSYQLDKSPGIAIKILSDLSIDRVQDVQLRENISKLLDDLHNSSDQN